MSARSAVTIVFFVDGGLFATWASRIPTLADHVGAGPGTLGLCLLAPAAAAVCTMPAVGRLLPGRSSRTFCWLAVVALTAAIILPALADDALELAAGLLAVGAANSSLDLAMNAQGVSIERTLARPILSSLHAAFSFGGFAGAGIGAVAAALQIDPLVHFVVAGAAFGAMGLGAAARLPRSDEDADARAPRPRWRAIPTRLALIGAACFFSLVAEGGAADWSAKLVRDDPTGTAALGAVAFATFSVAMGAGRLLADRLWTRWGAGGLVRRSGALAALGFAAGLAVGTAAGAIAGFAALGLGLAGVVPTLFRAGANQPGVPTGPALAVVSGLGYLGFLVGPPIIGGLAQLSSLRLACAVLVGAGLLVTLLAPVAGRRPERTGCEPLLDRL